MKSSRMPSATQPNMCDVKMAPFQRPALEWPTVLRDGARNVPALLLELEGYLVLSFQGNSACRLSYLLSRRDIDRRSKHPFQVIVDGSDERVARTRIQLGSTRWPRGSASGFTGFHAAGTRG